MFIIHYFEIVTTSISRWRPYANQTNRTYFSIWRPNDRQAPILLPQRSFLYHCDRYTRQCMQRIAFASYMHLPVCYSFWNLLTPQSRLLNTLRCQHNFYGPVASHVSALKKVNHKSFGVLFVQENVRDADRYYSTDGVGSPCSRKWF